MIRKGIVVVLVLFRAGVSTGLPEGVRAQTPTWTVDPTPSLVIGEVDGPDEYVLVNPLYGTVLGDGTVVLALYLKGYFELRYYDPDGKFLGSAGGVGEGPFEVGGWGILTMSPMAGDSIVVFERDGGVHVFGPRAEQVRSTHFRPPGFPMRGKMVDKSHLAMELLLEDPPSPGGVFQAPVRLTLMETEGGEVDTLATTPGVGRVEANGLAHEIPFSPLPFFATSGSGHLWYGHSSSPNIQVVSTGAVDLQPVHLDIQAKEVSRKDRSDYKACDANWWDERDRPTVLRYQRRMEFPDHVPFYAGLIGDQSGNLWVLHYEPRWSTEDYRWSVFDREGQEIAEATAPFSVLSPCTRTDPYGGCAFSVLEVGEDYILIVYRGGLDVPTVRKHRLIR